MAVAALVALNHDLVERRRQRPLALPRSCCPRHLAVAHLVSLSVALDFSADCRDGVLRRDRVQEADLPEVHAEHRCRPRAPRREQERAVPADAHYEVAGVELRDLVAGTVESVRRRRVQPHFYVLASEHLADVRGEIRGPRVPPLCDDSNAHTLTRGAVLEKPAGGGNYFSLCPDHPDMEPTAQCAAVRRRHRG